MARPFLFCLLWLAASVALDSDTVTAQEVNPLQNSRKLLAVGNTLFQERCADCHGADGRGVEDSGSPDLTQLWNKEGITEGSVFRTIRDGISETDMTPQDLLDNQIWSLVSHLRSIGVGIDTELPDGNNVTGAVLFATHCVACHSVNGNGSGLGPNLIEIIPQRTAAQLFHSVRNPDASVSNRYRQVHLVTREGEEVRGVVRNENNVSILIIDSNQEQRAFNKFSLSEITREEGSMMPAFSPAQLSDQQLVDIFDYIRTSGQ